MASSEAVCIVRVEQKATDPLQDHSAPDGNPSEDPEHQKLVQDDSKQESTTTQEDEKDGVHSNTNDKIYQEPFASIVDVPLETRLGWVKDLSELVLDRKKLDKHSNIRDWDLVLNLNSDNKTSINNLVSHDPQPASLTNRAYPPRYRIPTAILDRHDSGTEKIQLAEMFALGSLLYYVLAGKELFADVKGTEKEAEIIQSRLVKGEFPEDVWDLEKAVRVLGCWCPSFAKQLIAVRTADVTFRQKMAAYIRAHPVRFGFQVAGGIASLASLLVLPVIGLLGFGAAGPIANSVAAGYQASVGLIEAGSIFAWCQSAAMGGAAIGGILATGLAGAGVAVGATVSGALDNVDAKRPGLREEFLEAWRREVHGDGEEKGDAKL